MAERHRIVTGLGKAELERVLVRGIDLTLRRGIEGGGAGYGDPLVRDPALVLRDVARGWETKQRAAVIYAVVLAGSRDDDTLELNAAATKGLRNQMAGSRN